MPQVARARRRTSARVARTADDHRAAAALRQSAGQRARRAASGRGVRRCARPCEFVEGRRFTPGLARDQRRQGPRSADSRASRSAATSSSAQPSGKWSACIHGRRCVVRVGDWGDVDLIEPAFQRDGYQSMTVRLADPSMFDGSRRRCPPIPGSIWSRNASRITTPSSRRHDDSHPRVRRVRHADSRRLARFSGR